MRVLLVVHGYPPAAAAGTELYAEAHARALSHLHGDEVCVLTRDCDPAREDYATRTEDRDGVRVVFINNTYRRTRRFEDTYAGQEIGRVAAAIVDAFRPDVAHIHHLTHLSTAIVDLLAQRGIPTVMTLHDYWLICHRGQLLDAQYRVCDGPGEHGCGQCVGTAAGLGLTGFAGATVVRSVERAIPPAAAQRMRNAAERAARMVFSDSGAAEQAGRRAAHMRRVCDCITHFFAPSEFMRERFVQFGVARERITVSRYGIDRHRFATTERSAVAGPYGRSSAAGSPLRLGFFGSLIVSKAPHLLLAAAAQLPRDSVTVDLFGGAAAYHGDDSYRRVLEPLLSRAEVRVRGPIPHAQVPEALHSVDAVVIPSIWPENSPFVLHEALAAGVPVVASRIGGIPEMIEHDRNGLLFEAGNVDDLAQQLARLQHDRDLRRRLRECVPEIRTIPGDVAGMRRWYASPPQPIQRRRIAAIVLNFQTPDETLLAVRALLQSDRTIDDVIVVNNGRDDSLVPLQDALRAVSASIRIVHTGANLGFSGGMNAGIRAARERLADALLLVNSDVIVPPDCPGRLEHILATTPRAGIVGPVMVARTDPGRVASLGITYSHASGRMRHSQFGALVSETAIADMHDVDAISGCVMLIAGEVLDAIGSLDESFFFSFEDVDFCIRARQAGFRTVIAGATRVYHQGHRSIGRTTPARLYFAARNHLLLARRVNGSSLPFGLWAAPIVAFNVAHAVRAEGGSLPARLAAVARGTRDYALGRFGAGDESARLTG